MTLAFFDSNILVYAFAEDDVRTPIVRDLLAAGGVISVQSLNEFTNVVRRKMQFTWPEVAEAIQSIETFLPTVLPLTVDTHRLGRAISERYRLSVYDGQIVAAALIADCDLLYSEDMHDGLVIDGRLRIENPFAQTPR